MDRNLKVFVAGHRGMVGSSILRKMEFLGYENIITRTREELDLTNYQEVEEFFRVQRPDVVVLAAARVGGIAANIKYPVEFLNENIKIQLNVIENSYKYSVKKLVFLGSSCIYPKFAEQPLREEYLLSGKLEQTNEGYALAKIVGLKACEYYNKQYGSNFISVMPCNLYGIEDNFDPNHSHVVAGLINKFHNAKIMNKPYVEIWGSGKQYRELMFVDDMADATIYLLENYNGSEFINVGTGEDVTIRELAELIKKVVGYNGVLKFDITKPDGMFRKVLDVSMLRNLGWEYKIKLEEGLKYTYKWYLKNIV